MQKRFCDKCGKDISKEIPIEVSIREYSNTKPTYFDVCIECNKKYTTHSDTEFKNYTQKLIDFFKKEE